MPFSLQEKNYFFSSKKYIPQALLKKSGTSKKLARLSPSRNPYKRIRLEIFRV